MPPPAASQGFVMSPFLLLIHDCRPVHGANIIIKVADDTIVSDTIKDNHESASREEVESLDDGWNQSSAVDEEDQGAHSGSSPLLLDLSGVLNVTDDL